MLKRYFDIFSYSMVSYFVLLLLSNADWWQSWSSLCVGIIFSAESDLGKVLIPPATFALTGYLITKLGFHLKLYHPKQPRSSTLKYPPLSLSVGLAIVVWCGLHPDVVTEFYILPFSLIFGLIIAPIFSSIEPSSRKDENREDYLPKIKYEELANEPKIAADSIIQTLRKKERHIALNGAFGTGKTSAINAALGKYIEETDKPIVVCNIDLWGVSTNSVVEFALEEITLALSVHVDVNGLRGLPSNYLDAIRSSNTSWSFLSSLLKTHRSPDDLLKELDKLLSIIEMKLIVTIQDIDRNEHALRCMNEIAGLLDKLKENCNQITYIFAAENTPEFSETIRRICTSRIDLPKPLLTNEVNNLLQALTDSLPDNYFKVITGGDLNSNIRLTTKLLSSFRAFHLLKAGVNNAWGEGGKLKGEFFPHELILIFALKIEDPEMFDLVMLAGSSKDENSIDSLVDKHAPELSKSRKNLLWEICVDLGIVYRMSSWEETGKNEFIESPDVFSLMNTDRKRLIQKAQISSDDFSYFKTYVLFNNIAEGRHYLLDEVVSSIEKDSDEHLLRALERFGYRIFFMKPNESELPERMIRIYLEVRSSDVVYKLFNSLNNAYSNLTIGNNDNDFTRYVMSNNFLDQIKKLIPAFRASMIGHIIALVHRLGFVEKNQDKWKNEPYEIIRNILMNLYGDENAQKQALLIDLFRDSSLITSVVGEVLNKNEIKRFYDLIKNLDIESVELKKAYRMLYAEYSDVSSNLLFKHREEALISLEKISRMNG